MNERVRKVWLLILVASGLCCAAFVAAGGQVAPAAGDPTPAQPAVAEADRGARVFAENCARCHTPPMTLSQRVTGTVVMHMRIRARLSRKDEKVLLQYLAP
jgi:cytochrome c5